MARLEIRLLGVFEVRLGGQPVAGFESATTKALLARLAGSAGTPLRRAELAEQLWPNRPEGKALANLRHALAVLRRVVGDRAPHSIDAPSGVDPLVRPAIGAHDETLTLDPGADVWIDAHEFARLAATSADTPGAVAAWEAAAALRRGPFLDAFDTDISEAWETWLLATRAAVDNTATDVLERLAELRERSGELRRALTSATSQIAIDPWNERAQARVIRLYARTGRTAEAVARADAFVAALRDELGVEPSASFTATVDGVRHRQPSSHYSELADLPPRQARTPDAHCVAREPELSSLDQLLDDALGGTGRMAFVTGAAGSGKTTLVRAFARRARARMPELGVLSGSCDAFTGGGDPYLPFREILGLLCGDVEQAWTRGELSPADVAQLRDDIPAVVETVLHHGPYLLDGLIDATALAQRFGEALPDHPLRRRLDQAVAHAAHRAGDPMRTQQPLLEQCVRVLEQLAWRRPMLVIIDDLQWADAGTLDLLHRLSGRVDSAPLLVLIAYRTRDLAVAGADPVAALVAEAVTHKAAPSPIELSGTRHFVDAWLDTEPNTLDEDFRHHLFHSTQGHALYTVEMVAAMRDRGELVTDAQGRWTALDTLDWGTLSPRVEATIALRTSALPDSTRRDLEVASVQGETFRADVVAAVRKVEVDDLGLRLGDLAAAPDPLVEYAGSERPDAHVVHRYRFRHALYRQYLYDALGDQDRSTLHEATGRAMAEIAAAIDAGRIDEIAVDLALHFDAAGLDDEAVAHYERAARRALVLSATTDAVTHLRRALELTARGEPGVDRDRTELRLCSMLGGCLQALAGYNAPETHAVYERIRRLVAHAEPTLEYAEALGGLIVVDGLRARYRDAIDGAEHLLRLADTLAAPPIEALARCHLGWLLVMTAEFDAAERHLDRAIELYEPDWDEWLTHATGVHVGSTARAWRAVLAAHRGDVRRARLDAATAIADARRIGYPFGLVFALAVAGCTVATSCGDSADLVTFADEFAEVAEREGFAFYHAAADIHRGTGLALDGHLAAGLADIGHGLSGWATLGTEAFQAWIMSAYVYLLAVDGQADTAAAVLADLDDRLATGEERIADYWLPLARGATQRSAGELDAAETTLRDGLTTLQCDGVRAPAVRTAVLLAELLRDRGRPAESCAVLDQVLDRFAPSDVTGDLQRARDLRRTLACDGERRCGLDAP